MSRTSDYVISTKEFFADPFPTLRRMRDEDPVHFHAPLGIWFLTRFDHCDAVVCDLRFSNRRARELLGTLMPALRGTPDLEEMSARWSRLLWFLDPPRHTQSRSLVTRGFSSVALEHIRPKVAEIVRQALDEVRDRGTMDVAVDLADPVAINVLSALFGIPAADHANFRRWTADVLKGAGAGATSEEQAIRVKESSKSLFGYIFSLVEERRKNPGQDMISRFLEEGRGEPGMTEEVGFQCTQMIGAGYLTSANQISNAVLVLLRHPAELARLREDRGLLKSAIEEILRYEPSVLTTNRLCAEDVEIGGKLLKKGDLVFPVTAAANRDPAMFPDPDRFDIGRQGARHLTFSVGPHYCPGGALIRLEVEEALQAMLAFPRWELGDEPYDYGSFNLQDRGPKTLPIRFSASG